MSEVLSAPVRLHRSQGLRKSRKTTAVIPGRYARASMQDYSHVARFRAWVMHNRRQ